MEVSQDQHYPSRFPRNYGCGFHNHHTSASGDQRTRTSSRARHCPCTAGDEEWAAGDSTIKCSGKYCRSCTGWVIADCVAICCCPCAVLNILALALVKIPWTIGRRCLGRPGKKKGRRNPMKMEKERKLSGMSSSCDSMLDSEGIWEKGLGQEVTLEIALGDREGEETEKEKDNLSAERVWSELYQFGHLGFGRVSFTGNGFPS